MCWKDERWIVHKRRWVLEPFCHEKVTKGPNAFDELSTLPQWTATWLLCTEWSCAPGRGCRAPTLARGSFQFREMLSLRGPRMSWAGAAAVPTLFRGWMADRLPAGWRCFVSFFLYIFLVCVVSFCSFFFFFINTSRWMSKHHTHTPCYVAGLNWPWGFFVWFCFSNILPAHLTQRFQNNGFPSSAPLKQVMKCQFGKRLGELFSDLVCSFSDCTQDRG